MFSTNSHEQTILEFAQGGYIAISVESFMVDRQASGLSRYTSAYLLVRFLKTGMELK